MTAVAEHALETDREEFFLGKLWPEMPESWRHYQRVLALRMIFAAVFPDHDVFADAPLELPDGNQIRPDLSVLPANAVPAGDLGPLLTQAVWIAEVSLSTHDRDGFGKDVQYAEAGIPEYVIVDLKNRLVEVRTEPSSRGYLRRNPLFEGDEYRSLPIATLLGPAE